jgi:hypothetical protein
MGGHGPPGRVTGHELRARLGWGEPVVVELSIPEPLDGGAVELPIEQPAAPNTKHAIRSGLRTPPRSGNVRTNDDIPRTAGVRCLTLPVSPSRAHRLARPTSLHCMA